jgi:tripartite-type tricarboxylate transporter receptor subunit TctC
MRIALALLLVLVVNLVHAQEAWPSRPIRFILPFPPGGGTDILGRLIAERLSAGLGQAVIAENRGGAGGNVGAEAAARSAPDGYTIVLVAPSLAISPALYSKINYDPVKDFAPISLVATVPNVMVTQPTLPAQNLVEFIQYAKAKPGALNFGSGGAGTSNHLAGELFNIVTGVKLVHVPYKGVNLAMQDVLAGNVHLVFIGIPAAAPHIKSGKLRALAVVAPRRSPALPDVPTVNEQGFSGFDDLTWTAVFVAAGTPTDIVQRLNSELNRALSAPDVQERLAQLGLDWKSNTAGEFAAFLREEVQKWAKAVKDSGAKAD